MTVQLCLHYFGGYHTKYWISRKRYSFERTDRSFTRALQFLLFFNELGMRNEKETNMRAAYHIPIERM